MVIVFYQPDDLKPKPVTILTVPTSELMAAAEEGDVAKIEQCISKGANVDERSGAGDWTPLISAAWAGHTNAVKALLQHKANVDAQTSSQSTALIRAVEHDHKEVCQMLLEAGADKALVSMGKTAAEWAVHYDHKELGSFIDSWRVT